jgi:hypothetical protein
VPVLADPLSKKACIMPKLTMEVPHSLGREEAMRRLKEQFELARGAYGSYVGDLQQEWNDHTLTFGFKAAGMKVGGTLTVEEALVRVLADLPLAAMMLKKMIDQRVRQELGQVLGSSIAGPGSLPAV